MEYYRNFFSLKCSIFVNLTGRRTENHCQKRFKMQILFYGLRLSPVPQVNLFMQTAAGTCNVITLNFCTEVEICSCSLVRVWEFALTLFAK